MMSGEALETEALNEVAGELGVFPSQNTLFGVCSIDLPKKVIIKLNLMNLISMSPECKKMHPFSMFFPMISL